MQLIDIKKIIILLTICSVFIIGKAIALENKILIKVNNEIITTIDILDEINYLNLSNETFKNLDKYKIYEISKNSLIREKIKEIELLKNFNELKIDEEYYEELITNYFTNLGFVSAKEFKKYIKKNNISYEVIKKKITLEVLWKQLIYKKFSPNVKIDKKLIKKQILENDKINEYKLSEIVFNVEKKDELVEKLNLIQNFFKKNGFSNSALEHSISQTAKNGGDLGWIKESAISLNIKKIILETEVGNYTKPINIPGGFLILKLIDLRETKNDTNIQKEIELVLKKKTNDQLNQLSNIYFNKIKKNIEINEI